MIPLVVTVDSLYKRNSIPASLPDPDSIAGKVQKGYEFMGTFIPSNTGQVPGGWYKDSETPSNYYWAGGVSLQSSTPKVTSVNATVLGIDVSRYQDKAINWPQVKQNISFVYIKATEGVNTIDTLCKAHANGANAAGLKIGYYHFALVSKDAVEQARHFDNVIKNMPAASLPPVVDVEINKADLLPEEMEAWISTFINTMNSLNYPEVMIYSYSSFLTQNLSKNHSLGSNRLWIARYSKTLVSPPLPPGWDSFAIWQYDEAGTVPGILGKVDMNRAIIGFA